MLDRYGTVDAVWYLWALEDPALLQDQGAPVQVIQALVRAGIKRTTLLLAGEHESALERCFIESWIGHERSLRQVLPDLSLAVIHGPRCSEGETALDAERRGAGRDGETKWMRWANRLWEETHADKIESASYIEGRRHVLRMKPVEAPDEVVPPLRNGGTYLITGGLGGIGYLCASHLARRYAAHLILTGRSGIDAEKESRLQALEVLGGRAMYVAADVNDREQMCEALQRGREAFGTLHGVIHAAGVESRETILEKDIRQVEAVLAPKVAGTIALNDLLQDEVLDFVCYFSSSSAVLGDFGSCDYSVGNRFELAYAKYVDPRAMTVCWPLWAEGGMGLADAAATELYLSSSGQKALSAEEGLELLERMLALYWSGAANHALALRGYKTSLYRMLGLASGKKEASAPPATSKRRTELTGLTLAQCVEWDLKELASELLKLPQERLDVTDNLAQYGFDSIVLTEFAKRLAAKYEIELTPAVFFNYSSLSKLTEFLVSTHVEAVRKYYAEAQTASRDTERPTEEQRQARSRAQRREGQPTVSTARVRQVGRAEQPEPAQEVEPEREAARVRPEAAARSDDAVAIIGMSGRFPGARNVEELWQLIAGGRDAVTEIPIERFDWREIYQVAPADGPASPVPAGKISSKWLGAVPGVDEFDPLFFEISPREAELMDPRQRLLMQESYNALEDAGYGAAQSNGGRIGMFVGVEQGDYQTLLAERGAEPDITAKHDAVLAGRLSYFLNLRGPVMAINTACSSGLVAAHQARLSVLGEECDAAVAAGVTLVLTPQNYMGMSRAGMLSPDGRCHAFDRRANGIVPGEAVVAVVLKRLARAQRDSDVIHAVIRGSGTNYDGKTNGLTAPSGSAQAELLREVYSRAAVSPGDIEYVVAHGTGTRLGDPVEVGALKDAFGEVRRSEPWCALTSPKSNLGHTFAASGLVSLVCLTQAFRHDSIPASLHCQQLNEYIDWKDSPFYVNTQNRPWPKRDGKPRLGAVSAFGISGTNAHMVLESYDRDTQRDARAVAIQTVLLAISAKTELALRERARGLIAALRDERRRWDGADLASLSHTLLSYRRHFAFRCAVIAASREQVIALLEKVAASDEKHPMIMRGKVARDFVEQPMLREYADDLLKRLARLEGDAERYRQALAALGDLYCQGYAPSWAASYGDHPPRRISLPGYPFARERYWVQERGEGAAAEAGVGMLHPLVQ
ncbi:MAG: SDR family NAD(P)-dependent oxidoreductase, partial [Steroidobacteraceae bacterium]